MPFEQTKIWAREDFVAQAQKARANFRDQRIAEKRDYTGYYTTATGLFRPLLGRLTDIVSGTISYDDMATLLKTSDQFQAFCYLAGPPISADDFSTLSDTRKSSALWTRPNDVEASRAVIAKAVDPIRFPWIVEGRQPTDAEVVAAMVASSILIAKQKVETARRNEAKDEQEAAVMALLDAEGFERVARRTITLAGDAPPPGSYCPESVLGGTRGDIIVSLRDRRFMAIECKASNSEVNSFKRLNHEAVGKAVKWRNAFGHSVVPAAVLSGVFSVSNLESAQDSGLTIYWQHSLDELGEFIRRAA